MGVDRIEATVWIRYICLLCIFVLGVVTIGGSGDDGGNDTVVDTIGVGDFPIDIVTAENDKGDMYAYVTNLRSDNISIIDLSDNTVVDTISVGDEPRGLATNPPLYDRIYAVSFDDREIISLDPDDNVEDFTAGVTVGNPFDITVTPDNEYVWVTLYDKNMVMYSDLNTDAGIIPVGKRPQGIAITPSGNTIYVVNFNSNNVSVISTSGNTIVKTISVGSGPWDIAIGVNSGVTEAYVTNKNDDTVSVISVSGNTVVSTINVGDGPRGIACSRDGHYVYVANYNDDQVSKIDVSKNIEVQKIDVGSHPTSVAVSPDGEHVYVVESGDDTVSVLEQQ
ncbi:MAG: YncE family protein [Deltaproteobacteria bacterium]|nr:YncE family protein [Deltaproteobacteria bacterium]